MSKDDRHSELASDLEKTKQRISGTMEAMRKPGAVAPLASVIDAPTAVPEPVWVGWVFSAHRDGYMRQRLVIPQSVVEMWADGPPSPPDLRSNVVAQMMREAMSDDLVNDLHRKGE